MINASGNRVNEFHSVSEATTIIQSDGEASVGTSEVRIVAESEEQQFAAKDPKTLLEQDTEADYDADSESILPLFEDRLGYGIEEEYVQSPTRPRQVGVYMSGGGNQFDPTLLIKKITAENAEARTTELVTARAALEKQLTAI